MFKVALGIIINYLNRVFREPMSLKNKRNVAVTLSHTNSSALLIRSVIFLALVNLFQNQFVSCSAVDFHQYKDVFVATRNGLERMERISISQMNGPAYWDPKSRVIFSGETYKLALEFVNECLKNNAIPSEFSPENFKCFLNSICGYFRGTTFLRWGEGEAAANFRVACEFRKIILVYLSTMNPFNSTALFEPQDKVVIKKIS